MTTFSFILLGLLTLTSMPAILSHEVQKSARFLDIMETLRTDPEIRMTVTELITSKGYPCENYWVTTQDGYILNLQRIPHGRKNGDIQGPRPVVVMQHGLLGGSANYLSNLDYQCLPFILAEAGADVWLGNSRGNFYSRNHTSLDPDQEEFWEFSFDDMAEYDLPSVIDFVLSKTGVQQVFYVGHSQGSTIGFIGFGQNQELASKIKIFFALGPATKIGNIKSPLRLLAPIAEEIRVFLDLFGYGEFNVDRGLQQLVAHVLCTPLGLLCQNFLFLIAGFNEKSANTSRVGVYFAQSVFGTSTKNVLHWAQSVNSDQFKRFDYGSEAKNLNHYNQTTPPHYNISKVQVPVALFRGGADTMAVPEDTDWIVPQLPNLILDEFIVNYNHLDFIWAIDARIFVYNKIRDLILQYNK